MQLYSPSPLPDEHDLQPGQVLGPYELLVPAGAGGMAHVWAARHRTTGTVFALKMLMPHLAENSAFRDMFFDEARIASRIHHENVARTFELVELEGLLTLVMEWVDGSSLVQMLRPPTAPEDTRIPLPLREAVRILADTCAGLHAAHELVGDDGRPLAVVHRDVSPHNILLTRDGRVKVTDFGVAKAIGKSHMTIAGQVKGKLAYMSPEQLVGGAIDRRSDIFALGVCLFEATTGVRPFQGEHDPQIMAAIVMGNLVRPSEVMPSYPRALEDIILCALASEPDGRYATALQMKQALEGWLASSGPPLGPRNVATLLQERCGKELETRPGMISATQLGPPGAFAAEPASPPAPSQRRGSTAASEGVSIPAAVIAVLIGAVLGLGVLLYVKQARNERRATVEASASGAPALPVAPRATAAPARMAAPIADAGVFEPELDAASLRSSDVILHLPNGARMFVNGRELPPGSTSVPRPTTGVVTILVRAEGREDAFVEVRPSSPGDVHVPMAVKPKPKAAPSGDPSSGAVTTPPNPYD